MHRVIESEERNNGILVFIKDTLHSILLRNHGDGFLETGEHGTGTVGGVLAGITMSPNFGKHALKENELVWNKGIIRGEFLPAKIIPLNCNDVCGEGKQITQYRRVLIILVLQQNFRLGSLLEQTALNHLVHRRG